MKAIILLSIPLLFSYTVYAQQITGDDLLKLSIQYHDPSGNWEDFKGRLYISQQFPGRADRERIVLIDNQENQFRLVQTAGEVEIEMELRGDTCSAKLNGSSDFSDQDREKYKLDCDNIKRMRDYFTYLYGLPMKLQDQGTIVHEDIRHTTFEDKEYLELKVTYDESVGSDTWYFYFDPRNYALRGYKFYHDENKNDGEYITLEDEITLNGIKIPKIRKWYYNMNDKFLGTDDLVKVTPSK